MRRREVIAALSGALLAPLRIAYAQPRLPRVGFLWHGADEKDEAIYLGAVQQGLSDFGFVDGKNIILVHRFAAEIPDRFQSLANELAALNIDIFVANNRLAALAAQRATATIPIVFIAVPDPVGAGLVASLAHPGGNITGLSNFAHDLTGKRVEFLKQIVSSVTRVGLLVNANDRSGTRIYIEEAQNAASKLKIAIIPVEVATANDLEAMFSKMRDSQVDGLVVCQDGLFFSTRKNIADLALVQHLPAAVYSRETVAAGALVSYGPDNYGIFRRTGYYIDSILKGAKPADFPVEQPTKFEFIINLKTAKTLGLAIPQSMIVAADDVLE
jgi:putative ABC transport system substrate-binding protein